MPRPPFHDRFVPRDISADDGTPTAFRTNTARSPTPKWACVILGHAEATVCSPMLLSPVSRPFARNRGSRAFVRERARPRVACRPGALFTTRRRRRITPLHFEGTDAVRRRRRRTASVARVKTLITGVPPVMNSAPRQTSCPGAGCWWWWRGLVVNSAPGRQAAWGRDGGGGEVWL